MICIYIICMHTNITFFSSLAAETERLILHRFLVSKDLCFHRAKLVNKHQMEIKWNLFEEIHHERT